MMGIFAIMVYIALGVFQDFLITEYYIAVSDRSALKASVLGAVITLFTILIIEQCIVSRSIRLLVGYAVGTGIGTFFAIKRKR